MLNLCSIYYIARIQLQLEKLYKGFIYSFTKQNVMYLNIIIINLHRKNSIYMECLKKYA